MSRSIRVSDRLIAEAERSASIFHRSPPQQIEHWAQLGRVMEAALDWPTQEKVKAASLGQQMDEALAVVGTPVGRTKAFAVIKQTSVRPCGII